MPDFSSFVDLPLIWGLLIATAVLLYVLLDGFDLGVGILFPFAPSDTCRDRMMNSIAPFWDGNETWLVLGGGGLFVAFPLAYAVLLPAFYVPVIVMLLALIFRGVAFEFRFKSEGGQRWLWDYVFHFGSLGAAIAQGMILGGFIQGVETQDRNFSGGVLDWVSGFAVLCGLGVAAGYALLGACWTILKSDGGTQIWARRSAAYAAGMVAIAMALVSLSVPFVNEGIRAFWFSKPNIYWLLPIPLLTAALFALLWWDIHHARHELRPFLTAAGIFMMGYLGLGLSLFPWIVPYRFDLWQAAASAHSQTLMLIGTAPLLPVILAYTAWSYWVFRGKASHEGAY